MALSVLYVRSIYEIGIVWCVIRDVFVSVLGFHRGAEQRVFITVFYFDWAK
jgi:hypothetical protein